MACVLGNYIPKAVALGTAHGPRAACVDIALSRPARGRVTTAETAVDAVYGLGTGPPACGRFSPTPPAAAGPMGMLWGGRGLSATNSPLNLPYRGGVKRVLFRCVS